ncbi:MAG: hypothetical protein AAGG01_17075 [Planctomycetota bacterium]
MKLKTIKKTEKGAPAKSTSAAVDAAPVSETPVTGTRACPTRMDGVQPLFQHSVTKSQCQKKQRGMYHKCFTCAHANAR